MTEKQQFLFLWPRKLVRTNTKFYLEWTRDWCRHSSSLKIYCCLLRVHPADVDVAAAVDGVVRFEGCRSTSGWTWGTPSIEVLLVTHAERSRVQTLIRKIRILRKVRRPLGLGEKLASRRGFRIFDHRHRKSCQSDPLLEWLVENRLGTITELSQIDTDSNVRPIFKVDY